MNISAVIPTKNRPFDIEHAVRSVLLQSKLPLQLLVVDQSEGDASRELVTQMCAEVPEVILDYVHDPAIAGLVAAKAVSLSLARGDLVCFLEDDVVLEPDYFAEIESGFNQNPDMLGCCGVVVDVGPMPSGYVKFFQIFHRGIYMDPRVGVHGHVVGKGHALIPSPTLSGGLSAWRREVFDTVRFDTANDFFMLEDIEFSTRAAEALGTRFFINPNARLEHHASPVNRARLPARQRRKMREYIVFYKKRKTWARATSSLVWLMLGLFVESLFQTLRYRSPSLIVNFFAGILDGMRWKLKAS